MKKVTTIQKAKSFSLFKKSVVLALFGVSAAWSQVQNNDTFFIGDASYFYVGSGSYNFGASPAQTTTTRTASTYGVLIFASGASASGASATHFLDGYARTLSTSQFVFPVGQAGVYAPLAAIPTANTGVDAAYYSANPTTLGAAIDPTITAISSTEYWNVLSSSADATISLSWRATSDVTTLTSSVLADLTIAGWNGTAWVQIPSTVDATSFLGAASTLTDGSISTDASVDLNTFSAFTLASKGGACSPLVSSSGNVKTWNAGWLPSAPTLADPVVIAAPYAAGSFACNSITLDADVTLADGQSLEIVNGASGSGKVVMSSQASLVQRNGAATAPTIELTKQTRDIKMNDYVYWGTPIAGNFFSQLAAAQAVGGALTGAFDLKLKYNSGAGGGWATLTSTTSGSGYIMRVKQQAPFTTTAYAGKINLKFTGVANNGDVTVPVTNNPGAPNGGTSHNLLANPYPCAIDGDRFLTENTDVDGVLYVWQAATAPASGTGAYSQADYLTYTLAGSVAPAAITGTFNGKIASGQGFKVKALNAGNVTFTNCMRLLGDNTAFFRTTENATTLNHVDFDSYKVSMSNANGVFSQILVAYSDATTLGYDRLYDAGRNSVSTAQLYSVFEADGRKMAINARPTFADTDIVPLGVSKADTTAETFTLSISDKQGLFNNAGVNVYIHDTLNNTYHNLNSGDFTFTSTNVVNNQYRIVYQASTLSNPDFNSYVALANIKNSTFNVTATVGVTEIQIYDITGKLVQKFNAEGNTIVAQPFNHQEGFYIAKIKLENGGIATQKLINVK